MSSDRDNTFVKTVNGARGERDGREERPRQEEGSSVLTIPDLIDRIAAQNRELDELKVQQAKCDATLTRLAKVFVVSSILFTTLHTYILNYKRNYTL